MKTKLIALVALTLAACPAPTTNKPPPSTSLPQLDASAISKVSGSAHEHEPSIAVSPNGHAIVSFLAQTSAGYTVGYRISNDFGATWGDATLFPMPSGENTQANASVAVDDEDNVFMSWAAEQHTVQGRSNQHVFIASAPKGATTLGAPVQIDAPQTVLVYDLPRVFVARSGVVHVTYLQTNTDNSSILVDALSEDHGAHFTLATLADKGSFDSFRNFSRLCEGDRVYAVYADSDAAQFSGDFGVVVKASDDDGRTWSSAVAVPLGDDELTNPGFGIDCVAHGDDVWVTWSTSREANQGSSSMGGGILTIMPPLETLRVAHGSGAVVSFDAPVDFEDASAGAQFMYPAIVVDDEGALDVAYYAHAKADDAHDAFFASRSLDGATFSRAVSLHDGVALATDRAASTWGGDYIGRAFAHGDAFFVFSANASSTPHIDFVRVPVASLDSRERGDAAPNVLGAQGVAGCYVADAFTPSTSWAPPTPFAQGACSATQVSAYLACIGASCDSFRADAANAACLSCIETDASAAAHGPVVTTTSNGAVVPIAFNAGGCQAHFDGENGDDGCGAVSNAFNDCVTDECSTCADWSNPSEGGATYDCYFTAIQSGACAEHRITTTCANETAPGAPASSCLDLNAFLPQWCGP